MDVRSPPSYRISAVLIVASVALCALLMVWTGDSDAEDQDSGTIGELFWVFDGEYKLTITGAGEMDFSGCSGVAPWGPHMDDIMTIMIDDGVTSIASKAFDGCVYLTTITIPDSVKTIESDAFGDLEFYDTDGTTKLDIDADDLSGSTFKYSEGKLVKQTPGDDPEPGSPDDITSTIVAFAAGILSVALIFYVAIRY